jgi:hypothetical protein
VLLSVGIRVWRGRLQNAVTKKLSRTWAAISLWFGITGVVMVVARVESIQFLAMRFLWGVWGVLLLLLVALQWRVFRMRHYQVMPRATAKDDPRAKYLP